MWVKSFIASREARKHKQLSDARHLLEAALKTAGQLPRYWKMLAFTYDEFASLSIAEGKYAEAEQFRRSGLLLREKFDGPRAAETVIATSSLATLLDDLGKSTKAEPPHRHAVQMLQGLPGFASETCNSMNNYARCLHKLGRAMPSDVYKRALAIREAALPLEHPYRANLLDDFAALLTASGHPAEAADYAAQARTAREKHATEEASAV